MSRPQTLSVPNDIVDQLDLQKSVQMIVQRSNLKASLQPPEASKAMSSYLEPEEGQMKPWETWL